MTDLLVSCQVTKGPEANIPTMTIQQKDSGCIPKDTQTRPVKTANCHRETRFTLSNCGNSTSWPASLVPSLWLDSSASQSELQLGVTNHLLWSQGKGDHVPILNLGF